MRQKISVWPPKASRFMKLPQRPMIWPMSTPKTVKSSMARKGSFLRRVTSQMARIPPMMPP